MNTGLIPNEFKVNGELTIKADRDSLLLVAAVILIVIIFSFIAWRALK